MRAILVGLVLGCAGCASNLETTWQAVHLTDGLQTLSAARDACYDEEDPITRRIIGRQPSDGEVIAWWAGLAIAHAGVSHWLERWPRWQKAWQLVTIGNSAVIVARNHHNGVRIAGENRSDCR